MPYFSQQTQNNKNLIKPTPKHFKSEVINSSQIFTATQNSCQNQNLVHILTSK